MAAEPSQSTSPEMQELRARLRAEEKRLALVQEIGQALSKVLDLDQLLKLGCAANNQGGLTVPWYFEQHIDQVDSMSGMLVTGEKVPLLAAPDPKGPVIETISWDVVTLTALKPDDPFQHVVTTAGREGYIATDKLRSLLDYRLLATSRNGKWSVVSLVAGD